VGLYISGGLDSSLVSAKTKQLAPQVRRYSFSIDFGERDKSEAKYQRMMAEHIDSIHSEKLFLYTDISQRLRKAVYHSEYPLKETYNTASLALSEAARSSTIKVVLTGEGADEWFAGYPGYKFDKLRIMQRQMDDYQQTINRQTLLEQQINKEFWGDENLSFDIHQYAFGKIKKELYSEAINKQFHRFNCHKFKIVNKERLLGRDILHKRSYLDYKLRLVSHLIADHGDRMAYANSVEARYPFLDKNLVEFAAAIPPKLKLKEFDEKYILKKLAKRIIPEEILKREKFAFHAPGSPYLLKRNIEYINDLLSYKTIKSQGYFNPDTVEKLKKQYRTENFRLNIPYETDLLIILITFGIFLEAFEMPNFNE
jgi:asparagine synthase (glutamine-hydrolysing)